MLKRLAGLGWIGGLLCALGAVLLAVLANVYIACLGGARCIDHGTAVLRPEPGKLGFTSRTQIAAWVTLGTA